MILPRVFLKFFLCFFYAVFSCVLLLRTVNRRKALITISSSGGGDDATMGFLRLIIDYRIIHIANLLAHKKVFSRRGSSTRILGAEDGCPCSYLYLTLGSRVPLLLCHHRLNKTLVIHGKAHASVVAHVGLTHSHRGVRKVIP